ncbi:MAG: acylneuraminate cytidylyltransferase [Methylomarinum sp.]|nr:acylneuraminate cytidylyltransferase [Methylomarinum sp.]
MIQTKKVLIIIPARGGSKGIPRKNLRSLAGKPLLYYSVKMAFRSCYKPDVYVSSDDEEILTIAKKLGSKVIHRDASKAQDQTTLDPVIYDAYKQAEAKEKKSYDVIITLQPTSPLLKTSSLDSAIEKLIQNSDIDTVISAKIDTHLTWKQRDGRFVPNYEKRVNRQFLEPIYKETGGFLITRKTKITETNRIGKNVELHLLSEGEAIDIDTYEDWNICEFSLKRKKILFVVSGYKEIGLGHAYNTLLIANDILNHRIEFLVDNKSQLAFEKIASKNYQVHIQKHNDIIEDIKLLSPNVVINDILDTDAHYIKSIKKLNIKVINFEDLGTGALEADLVVNAIYPEKALLPKHYFGHEYFILRDEFILTYPKPVVEKVNHVLLAFGGVDPNNFTKKVIESIQTCCQQYQVKISVVAGFGYDQYESLEQYVDIDIYTNSAVIAEHMKQADIVFTSAGRTTYEVASLCIPTIVLAQNEREMTHFFASAEYGFINLGLGRNVACNQIQEAFVSLVENFQTRRYMSQLMAKTDLVRGRARTLKLINEVVDLT